MISKELDFVRKKLIQLKQEKLEEKLRLEYEAYEQDKRFEELMKKKKI
jgi:hypothetical protein